jgi:hypothetical protein
MGTRHCVPRRASYVQIFVDPRWAVGGVGGALSTEADVRLGDSVVSQMVG